MPYHLELLNTTQDYNVFSRAHMSYINQIFGDVTVRHILQEVYPKQNSRLLVEKTDFHSTHHVLERNGIKICSIDFGYQDLEVDINDTLCQSYSLMSYLELPFDSMPSSEATEKQKYSKQMSMIKMYRDILENKRFRKVFSNEIVYEENNYLWKDTVNHKNTFYIIKQQKTSTRIINNIKKVLDAWEKFGWKYFIGSSYKGQS